MKRTPTGTPVGVDDPLDAVDRCDWVTRDGRCRLAFERPEVDPAFAERRRADDYRCPFVPEDVPWVECTHFTSRSRDRRCVRCGLEERRLLLDPDERPLLQEHHLAYGDDDGAEVTVMVCRWCHAKIHRQGARIDDDAVPDRRAVAERERRKDRERGTSFRPASDHRED